MTPVSEAGTSVERCPFCDGEGKTCHNGGVVYVVCLDCHSQGPAISTSHPQVVAKAVARWNRRALIQPSTVPTGEVVAIDLRTLVPGFRLDWSGLRNRFEEDLARFEKISTYEMRSAHLDEMARQFEDAILAALQTPSKTVGAAVTHRIRAKAFSDIMRFQPDSSTGVDAYEQIAIHARSTIIEAQKQIAAIAGAPNA